MVDIFMEKAVVMEIQRFSIHDGPGIRTTVFFKGCHMRCQWCHNPESHNSEPEMLFFQEHCIGCGSCLSVCKREAHSLQNDIHYLDLKCCQGCPNMMDCSQSCPTEALRLCGRWMDAQQILREVLIDRAFYGKEGGVTCSGGEALLQNKFLLEFLPMCKGEGISTCVDTTLNVSWNQVENLLPWTDLFLVDLKFTNQKVHKDYTGVSGEQTIENLYRLSEIQKPVILRMPLLQGVNDADAEGNSRKTLLENLSNVMRIDCFAVTNHGTAKYKALQREYMLFNQGVDLEMIVKDMEKCLYDN